MAWVVLLASAAAIVVIGLIGTTVILGSLQGPPAAAGPGLWIRFFGACGLTIASLGLRSLRWIFLLRRTETRIPIRDAYIGYFSGLSLLLTPFLIGEIAVRAAIQRTRGRVPIAITILVNFWDRFLDLTALAVIAGVTDALIRGVNALNAGIVLATGLTLLKPVRTACLSALDVISRRVSGLFEVGRPHDLARLPGTRAWVIALGASVVAWALPGIGLWLLANTWNGRFELVAAARAYAVSAGLGGLVAAPGGVLVAGGQLLNSLGSAGFPAPEAALVVLAIRLATLGVATVLGAVFLLMHFRSPQSSEALHFDAIADAYDVQIPESRRHALLARKTEMMRDVLQKTGAGGVGMKGLDVGCGQGAYVGRMRELGYDVSGIDSSAGQVMLAARQLNAPGIISHGSVLEIPARDASCDFVYIINVLHHLPSADDQRRAFRELFRVLRPGGLLFVHEINTRNVLFRFYMGYVFPSLNCIDEGVERWLLADRLGVYTDAAVTEVRYFTFLPDFLPQGVVRLLTPLERLLERSPLAVYSAHYMAVLQKRSG
jgi:ubiquinone/menaquinone biosynthesis C-methylase UbiE/uncharacterized membrane protein YbhN (UPF0104 family)